MTRYMPILPIGMLSLFNECNVNDAFILPQFWNDDSYRMIYQSRKWDRVVIDNAMYENPEAVDVASLIEIAETLDSVKTYIVGPESIGHGEETVDMMCKAIAEHGPRGSKWNMMMVFQGSPTSMFNAYREMKQFEIGFAFPVSLYRDGWSRAGLKYFTGIRNHYVHALGIDDMTEIPDLVRAGIDSFDSSIAASAAINGIDILGNDLRIIRKGLSTDPKRVDLTQIHFKGEIRDETAMNIDDIRSTIGSIKIEARGT